MPISINLMIIEGPTDAIYLDVMTNFIIVIGHTDMYVHRYNN